MSTSLADLSRTFFEPLLHARFSMRVGPEQSLELELVELKSLGAARGNWREPFSLIFAGPGVPWVHQGTYSVEHPELGCQPLFLVPVGPDATGRMQYQAIFN
jgi:hypothetical protein